MQVKLVQGLVILLSLKLHQNLPGCRQSAARQDKNFTRKDKQPGLDVDKVGPQCSSTFPEMDSRQVELADN